ncbi:MAG: PLP-dependent aminotransferase family protein [Candidatus Thermoplasmatota archaeon]|nr:PLP-dependent aminotransferase family protein [Candidatus Thermoplasmatota archaeon]
MINFEEEFSERASKMKRSEIRELLKLIQKPDIISFAGGLPNPKAFPVEETRKIINELLDEKGEKVLQYGSTEGIGPLRKELAKMMQGRDMDVDQENILITHGSQQALDLLSKVMLDPDDTIIVGSPTYLGATGAFRAFEANMETVPVHKDGMDMEMLRRKLGKLKNKGKLPKFIYVVLTFQNPSGATMSAEKREELLEIASEYDLLVVEDSPYSHLRYEGEEKPHLISMDDEDRVLRLETFSKILAPGFRIAWTTGPTDLIEKMCIAKQATDLCTNPFGQYVAYKYIAEGIMDNHIEDIKELYNKKRLTMLEAMEEHFPEGVEWNRPNGGMFIWAELPEHINTRELFDKAVDEKVAYVVGDAFFVDDGGYNTMRINFTHSSEEEIKRGIKALGKVIQEEIETMDVEEESPISP